MWYLSQTMNGGARIIRAQIPRGNRKTQAARDEKHIDSHCRGCRRTGQGCENRKASASVRDKGQAEGHGKG